MKTFFITLWGGLLEIVFPASVSVHELEMVAREPHSAARCLHDWQRAEPPALHFSHAIFSYRQEMVRAAIWEVKYRRNVLVADLLGRVLGEKMCEVIGRLGWQMVPILVVPIPLSPQRLRERGYDQISLMLGFALPIVRGCCFGVTLANDVVMKNAHTVPQSHTNTREERLRNLRGVFTVRDDAEKRAALRGAHIILVDDVITTGATMSEVREVLMAAGAANVFCIALAH